MSYGPEAANAPEAIRLLSAQLAASEAEVRRMDWLETQDCWIGVKPNWCGDGCEAIEAAGGQYSEKVRAVCDAGLAKIAAGGLKS